MKRKRTIWVALVTLTLVVGGALGYRFFMQPKDADAKIPGEGLSVEGKLLPEVRRCVYYENGIRGKIVRLDVKPGDQVSENRTLMYVQDIELEKQFKDMKTRMDDANEKAKSNELLGSNAADPKDAAQFKSDARLKRNEADDLQKRIDKIREIMEVSDDRVNGEIVFALKAPGFTTEESLLLNDRREWTILDNKEEMTTGTVGPNDPILRLGALHGPWELEIRIPEKHIDQVMQAFDRLHTKELDVDFVLKSDSTKMFLGKRAAIRSLASRTVARAMIRRRPPQPPRCWWPMFASTAPTSSHQNGCRRKYW